MANWGWTVAGAVELNQTDARAMGGTSPDKDDMILRGVSIYIGTIHTGQGRVAIYTGGSLTTGPDGATLLHDFGQTTGTDTDTWFTWNYTDSDIIIPKNTVLWVAFKSDAGYTSVNQTSHPAASDWQSANGRYASVAVAADDTVAYPATWPADTGTFGNWWYSMYLSYSIGEFAYGIRFRNADEDYLSSTPTTLAPPVNSSISFWMYVMSYPESISRILGTGNTYELRISPDGFLDNDMFQGTGGAVPSLTSFQIGTLYHIVCTRASDDTAQIFSNGLLDNSGNGADGSPGAAVWEIGHRPGISTGYFDGLLEDVRIYNRVLSLAEVQTIYACRGIDNITYGLLHRWPLNELPQGTRTTASGVAKDICPAQMNLSAFTSSGTGPEYVGNMNRIKRLMVATKYHQ